MIAKELCNRSGVPGTICLSYDVQVNVRRRGPHRAKSAGRDAGPAILETHPRVKERQPQFPKYDRPHPNSGEIIFGVEPVREMIAAAPSRILTLYVKLEAQDRFRSEIEAVRSAGGRIIGSTIPELSRMAGSEQRHQGIIAAIREYGYSRFEDIVQLTPDPLLLLDGITDPRNLGTIMRVAECAGLDAVVLAKDRTVGVTPGAIKSSAGAWAHLRIARCGNVAQTLENLRAEGYWVAALDPRGETALSDLDVTRRLTLVLGSEGHGIRDLVRKKADFVVRIPMYGRVGSLNVSVAAAIALFDIARRRGKHPNTGPAINALQEDHS